MISGLVSVAPVLISVVGSKVSDSMVLKGDGMVDKYFSLRFFAYRVIDLLVYELWVRNGSLDCGLRLSCFDIVWYFVDGIC